jgi:hypothetical protein
MDRFFELMDKTPFSDGIEAYYDPSKRDTGTKLQD